MRFSKKLNFVIIISLINEWAHYTYLKLLHHRTTTTMQSNDVNGDFSSINIGECGCSEGSAAGHFSNLCNALTRSYDSRLETIVTFP